MGVEAVIATLIGVAGIAGGWFGGKRTSDRGAVTIATETVELLQVQIEILKAENGDLKARVEVLEALVTQRAEVELVKQEVHGVRGVVDRIAFKVGA